LLDLPHQHPAEYGDYDDDHVQPMHRRHRRCLRDDDYYDGPGPDDSGYDVV
jgi:hypothetical protein